MRDPCESDDVEAVSRAGAVAVLDNGERLPITNWFDLDGDECEPDDAISVVAGPDRNGFWYAIDLEQFQPIQVH